MLDFEVIGALQSLTTLCPAIGFRLLNLSLRPSYHSAMWQTSRLGDHGLAPPHIAPNDYRGFAHSIAGASANMSEPFMELPIPTYVAHDDPIPLHYDLRDFAVVDAEVC